MNRQAAEAALWCRGGPVRLVGGQFQHTSMARLIFERVHPVGIRIGADLGDDLIQEALHRICSVGGANRAPPKNGHFHIGRRQADIDVLNAARCTADINSKLRGSDTPQRITRNQDVEG